MPTDPTAILDLIHESVVMCDMDGRVIFWNEAAGALYGWPPAEALGRNFRELVCIDEAETTSAAKAALLATGRWEGELRRRNAAGEALVIDVRWALSRDGRGTPVATVETGRDVTARKADEERLRYSEHRYRNLFQAMAASFWEIDFSGVDDVLRRIYRSGVSDFAAYFAANPDAVREMMRAARVVDVNDETVALFGNGDKQALIRDLEPFWAKGSEHVFTDGILAGMAGKANYATETRLRAIDGREFDALFTASFPPDTMGKGSLVIGVIDISERKRAERELRQVQADFAHASRVSMLGELTASIAHEINQPLAAIATNGEAGLRWLDRATPDVGEVQSLTSRIVADARRAADIIARIRTMAANHAPEQAIVALNPLVADAAALLRHEIDAYQVELLLDLAPDLPPVVADCVQLQQVIVNLAINAVHAMTAQDGPRRLVLATWVDDAGMLAVRVDDSGPGIAPDDLPRIFDSFFSTKSGGMGIGLAMCRSIVEAHGGQIEARNRVGGGARFAFTLPVATEG
ncbi:MAG: PAS domain-containing sensor histidine kinase [Sphingopyxis sp.]|nr:PAS domain-containing sensor histidine kinase [Sphingopyxis sp.]